MQPTPDAQRLRHSRRHLVEHGECPPGVLDERLSRSWHRSFQSGLMPTGRLLDVALCTGSELQQLTTRHHDLLAHSRPVMEFLFEQVRHQPAMVVLASPCGTLMHTLGDAHFLSRADRVALNVGASWTEAHRGTNAIGTALADVHAIQVNGSEHYLERNGFLTCSAAPIVSATGELLGALDVSSEHREGPGPVLGLVRTAAALIENRLLGATYRHHWRLHLHTLPEGLNSVGEGIVVLSDDGWVVGANQAAQKLLHQDLRQLRGRQLHDLLHTRLEDLLAQQSNRDHTGDRPAAVRLVRDGRALYAQLQARPALWQAHAGANGARSPAPARGPAPVTPTAPGTDALARLDTGDARWRSAADKARKVLNKPISLLVLGESGVGKELFAKAAHRSGPRAHQAFVAINCAAMPEGLIESELFGHAPGAFTGARRQGNLGLLREAHQGTLFLDEIGDMPLALQTRLLRVLQERQVAPLGGGQPVAVDFALICATHQPLKALVAQGRFREDLYYRINGLVLELPALRERTDFAALTQRLLLDLAEGAVPPTVDPALLEAFTRHPWPGNTRQYLNALRTACALLEPGETVLGWQHLSDDLRAELQTLPPPPHTPAHGAPGPMVQPQSLKDVSRTVVLQAVESCRGNVAQAARQLGISRQTVYRKLQATGA
jgi:transcriptional regulator of acetoin/glycerol metabolism